MYADRASNFTPTEQVRNAVEAVAVAEATGDPSAIIHAHYALTWATAATGEFERPLELAAANLARCDSTTSPEDVVMALNAMTNMLVRVGRYEENIPFAARGREVARRTGLAGRRGSLMTSYWVEALVWLGRWDEAERLIAGSADDLEDVMANPEALGIWGLALLRQGRLQEARSAIEVTRAQIARGSVEWVGSASSLIVEFDVADGTFDAAPPILDAWLAGALGDPEDETALAASVLRAIASTCTAADDVAVERASRWRERTARLRTAIPVQMVDHHLDLDEADAHWQRFIGRSDPAAWAAVAAGWARLRRPYDEAVARLRQAEAHLGGAAGRTAAARHAAAEQLGRADEIATTLRASALRAEIEDLARRARIALEPDGGDADAVHESPAVRRAVPPHELSRLTARERDVLDLLAAGRSNGEIGKALFISTKTASVHVSHILAKLGVTNRVEAAALAVRNATPA